MRWTTILNFAFPLSLVEAALQWHNASIAHVPSEWLYLLPQPFDSAIQYGWLNSTTTGNSTINSVLANANNSRIVSYSDEFTDLVGPNPTWATIQSPPNDPYGAYEGGAWIPETDEVWFGYNGSFYPYRNTITSFNLQNGTSRQVVTDPPISYPYGMYYWPRDGQVYVTEINTPTDPASVVAIDPITLKMEPVQDSLFMMP
ncbi:hypothetical protein PRZ48_006730 [Zasmidium cellare]|uniref:Uncharacterized protein n=1 Tax=Zasmidium cellare TaxID=395010 RepID=A0ABR0EPA4_ZASCE|nr:hypothetical protein PRZ48_006730 [Zasmidium cellare]